MKNLRDDDPPFLGSWKRVYLSVIFYLFALIALLWLISWNFRYE